MTDSTLITHETLLRHAGHHLTVRNEDNEDVQAPVCLASLYCLTCQAGTLSVAEDELLEVRPA